MNLNEDGEFLFGKCIKKYNVRSTYLRHIAYGNKDIFINRADPPARAINAIGYDVKYIFHGETLKKHFLFNYKGKKNEIIKRMITFCHRDLKLNRPMYTQPLFTERTGMARVNYYRIRGKYRISHDMCIRYMSSFGYEFDIYLYKDGYEITPENYLEHVNKMKREL